MPPAWVGTQPAASYDAENDAIIITVGPETFTWPLSDFAAIAGGATAMETLKTNVVICCLMEGAHMNNPVELVNCINRFSFKYHR